MLRQYPVDTQLLDLFIDIPHRLYGTHIMLNEILGKLYIRFLRIQTPLPVKYGKHVTRKQGGRLFVVAHHIPREMQVRRMIEKDSPARFQFKHITVTDR